MESLRLTKIVSLSQKMSAAYSPINTNLSISSLAKSPNPDPLTFGISVIPSLRGGKYLYF